MELLTEDATYLAGGLGILGAIFLIVLKVTQQGRYLIRALIALGLAAIVLGVEWLWVTDNERIEQVVYDLRRAVVASDSAAVITHLTPNVEYSQSGQSLSGDAVRKFITEQLQRAQFDFMRISQLETHAGSQSGRGSAVFRVTSSGSYRADFMPVAMNFGGANLDFSLGFQQEKSGVWKVDRISLTRGPREMPMPGGISIPKNARPSFSTRRPPRNPFSRERFSRKRYPFPGGPPGDDPSKATESSTTSETRPKLQDLPSLDSLSLPK
ncbi:hypothetical protein [Singulisphaera sp. PoT]|uniref:hypothetical protein n=1 Tax=Singulisphaera sp. PoT TaxID=3411797 RepID=UPI003BF5CC01